MARAEIDWSYPPVHMKDQVLGNVSGGTFRTPSDIISHRIHIVRTSCSQLPAWCVIFCLLVEVVYVPCGLKFEYPMINLPFPRIIFKLNFLWNFVCTVLNDFSSNKLWRKMFFPLLSKSLWSRINSCYSLLFSNLKQKRTQHYYE